MKELSELLKNTRTSKNLNIEEISAQTKIQLHILKSLEDGDIDQLPNKIYLKGFLRQYARVLGLNEADVIAMYDKEVSAAAPPPPPKPAPAARADNNQIMTEKTNVLWFRAPAKFITVAGIGIIVFLITAIYFLSMKIVSYSQETFKESVTESSEPPTPAQTPQLETIIEKKEESLALPKPAAQPSETSNTAGNEPASEEGKPKIVAVEATDMVSIEAAWSTGKKETITLKANSRHVFYYAKKIKLVISDGGGVTVNANDKDLGTPGEAGKPVTLNFE